MQDRQRAGRQAGLHPVLHAVVAVALDGIGAEQINVGVGGRDRKRLPCGNLGHNGEAFGQGDQAVAAVYVQKQRGLAASGRNALQRGPAVVVACDLGGGAGVDDRNVGVKHGHDAVLALPVQPQQHAARVGGVEQALGVGVEAHKVDRAVQLPVPRGNHARGKPAVVGGKVQRDRCAHRLGHPPAVQLPHRRVIDVYPAGKTVRVGHDGQRVVV